MRSDIKLFNMDCMDALREMETNAFDLAIVDPPYGINQDRVQNELGGKKGFNKESGTFKQYHKTNWDDSVPTKEYFNELFRVSKNQIIWGGNYFFTLDLSGVIIWNKGNSGKFKEGEFAKTSFNTFKLFYYSRADAYINKIDMKIHPTQKPVALYKWLLKNYAKEGDSILDTHLGSGSIALACHDAGYDLTGYELDEDYFKAALHRLGEHKKQGQFEFA